MDEFGKVGAEMSHPQSQMHSDYDSAQSTADSDLEDGELPKMLVSPLYMQSREDCESSRMPIEPGKLAAFFFYRKEEQVQSVLELSLMSSSSQEPRAYGKPDAMFSSGSKEPGNQLKSSIFKHSDPSNVGRSLLEGDKEQMICQARSELASATSLCSTTGIGGHPSLIH